MREKGREMKKRRKRGRGFVKSAFLSGETITGCVPSQGVQIFYQKIYLPSEDLFQNKFDHQGCCKCRSGRNNKKQGLWKRV